MATLAASILFLFAFAASRDQEFTYDIDNDIRQSGIFS